MKQYYLFVAIILLTGCAVDDPGDSEEVTGEAELAVTSIAPFCNVYADSNVPIDARHLSVSTNYSDLHIVKSGQWVWNTWGDIISSVRCFNGQDANGIVIVPYMWAYRDKYFAGPCVKLAGTIGTLHTSAWGKVGDKISSIGFMSRPNGPNGPCTETVNW